MVHTRVSHSSALLERLYCGGLITLGELQKLFLDDNAKRSRMLLVSILREEDPIRLTDLINSDYLVSRDDGVLVAAPEIILR